MNKRGLILSFSLIVIIVTVIVVGLNFSSPNQLLWQKAQVTPTPLALQTVELKETFTSPVKRIVRNPAGDGQRFQSVSFSSPQGLLFTPLFPVRLLMLLANFPRDARI